MPPSPLESPLLVEAPMCRGRHCQRLLIPEPPPLVFPPLLLSSHPLPICDSFGRSHCPPASTPGRPLRGFSDCHHAGRTPGPAAPTRRHHHLCSSTSVRPSHDQ
jgi:hypothetical protein